MEIKIEYEAQMYGMKLLGVLYGDYLCHRCGYVGVKKPSMLWGIEASDEILDGIRVHGGITHANNDHNEMFGTAGYWYFGFDCAHAYDMQDVKSAKEYGFTLPLTETYKPFDDANIRTKEYVIEQVQELAQQLHALSNRLDGKHRSREVKYEGAKFQPGEIVLYEKGDSFLLGEVKRVEPVATDVAGGITVYDYFVWYHTGDTAARTREESLHKIRNSYAFDIRRKRVTDE